MELVAILRHINELNESLDENLQVHINSYRQILFRYIGKQGLLSFTSTFSNLIRRFVTLLLEHILYLDFNVPEINTIFSDFHLDLLRLALVSVHDVSRLTGLYVHDLSLLLFLERDPVIMVQSFHDFVVCCLTTSDELNLVFDPVSVDHEIAGDGGHLESLFDVEILFDNMIPQDS